MTREEALQRAIKAAERAEAAAALSNASAHDCALAYVAVADAWVRIAALSPQRRAMPLRALAAGPPGASRSKRA